MTDSTLVFTDEGGGGRRLVVNFGVHSGREATEAEIYRLAQSLLQELDSVAIVSEQRFELAPDVEATVHQIYVELPARTGADEDRLVSLAEEWAADAIGERRRLVP